MNQSARHQIFAFGRTNAVTFTGLFAFLFLLLAVTQGHVYKAWKTNGRLLCMLGAESDLADKLCGGRKTKQEEISSLTVAALEAVQQGRVDDELLTSACRTSLCTCTLPGPWEGTVSRDDPRSRLIAFYTALTVASKWEEIPRVDTCALYLPSSSIMRFWQYDYLALGQAKVATFIGELAYEADHGWIQDDHRALNAYEQGAAYLAEGHLHEAQSAFERARAEFERSGHVHRDFYLGSSYHNLAYIMEAQGNEVKALVLYAMAILARPQDAASSVDAYLELLFKALPERAEKELERLVFEEAAGHKTLLYTVIVGLVNLEKVESARELIARQLDRDDPYVIAAQAAIERYEGDLTQAAVTLERAITSIRGTDPSTAATWASHLANVYRAAGLWDRGVAAQEWAVELEPERPWLWYTLARLYHEQGRDNQARVALAEALSRDPENEVFEELQRVLLAGASE